MQILCRQREREHEKKCPYKGADGKSLVRRGHGYGGSKEARIIALRHQGKDYPGFKGSLPLNTH